MCRPAAAPRSSSSSRATCRVLKRCERRPMPTPRKPLISGNWKMHHNPFDAIQTIQKLAFRLTDKDYEVVDVSVHPPFTNLRSLQTVIDADKLDIALGAQNCFWEDKGAFT